MSQPTAPKPSENGFCFGTKLGGVAVQHLLGMEIQVTPGKESKIQSGFTSGRMEGGKMLTDVDLEKDFYAWCGECRRGRCHSDHVFWSTFSWENPIPRVTEPGKRSDYLREVEEAKQAKIAKLEQRVLTLEPADPTRPGIVTTGLETRPSLNRVNPILVSEIPKEQEPIDWEKVREYKKKWRSYIPKDAPLTPSPNRAFHIECSVPKSWTNPFCNLCSLPTLHSHEEIRVPTSTPEDSPDSMETNPCTPEPSEESLSDTEKILVKSGVGGEILF